MWYQPLIKYQGDKGMSMYQPFVIVVRAAIPLLILLSVLVGSAARATVPEQGDASTALITGSNRGIGLEFVRQYAEAGWQVIATCRSPERADELQQLARSNRAISIEQLDITDPGEIDRLQQKLRGKPLHLLINNAALLGPRDQQSFAQLDYELAQTQFDVNALGPLRVAAAFLPNLLSGGPGKIVTLGSAAGSHGYLRPPADFYSYRASKAALHFLMHNLALELAGQGVVVGLLNPGLVDTRGLADIGPDDPVPDDFKQVVELIRTGRIELIPPSESVAAMIEVIEKLGPEESGLFLNYDGQPVPW